MRSSVSLTCCQVPATLKILRDANMDQDERSAALRNMGLVRQARYADRDRTAAKDMIKHMRKAGISALIAIDQGLGFNNYC